jgi:UDP-arabinose 4-epimerase
MKVLVAGGAGFIGSHACKAMAKAGHEPIVFDDLSTGHAHAVRWGPLEVGDIRDSDRLDAVMARHRPDLVMHFAALAYVGVSVRDPASYYDVNIGGTLNLLKCMKKNAVDKIVFSSSCATYGAPDRLPIREDTPQDPINPYGFTKLAAERMLLDFEAAYGLRWMALRYFNAAGSDPEGDLGEEHDPETHAIPLALQAALGLAPAFTVFGDDYDTPDGSAVRDYVHVCDLADAHVRAAEHLAAGGRSAACNLATGSGTSVLELLAAVKAATGRTVPVLRGPRRAGDPPMLFASADRARDLLGWRPRFVSIVETVETAAHWFQRNLGGRAAGTVDLTIGASRA